jgi:hypothetical protein
MRRISHSQRVGDAGKRCVAELVKGKVTSGNHAYDVISGNGTLIEVKTALLTRTGYGSSFSELPVGQRWHWSHLYGTGKESKGAQCLILVASHRLIDGPGPFLQRPDFYDLDYEQILDALKDPNEGITLTEFRGRNDWSRILPAFKRKSEDLTRLYGPVIADREETR